MSAETLRDALLDDIEMWYPGEAIFDGGLRRAIDAIIAAARAESDALRAALVLLVDATGLLLSASETPLHDGWQMAPDWTAADFACQVARAALAPSPAEPETWGAHAFVGGWQDDPERCKWTDGRWSACKAGRDAACHEGFTPSPAEPAAPERCAWDKGDEEANLSPGEVCKGLRSDHDDGGVYAPAYWSHPFQPAAPERDRRYYPYTMEHDPECLDCDAFILDHRAPEREP